jgi:large subunit ribosomal protein L9
LSIQLCNQSELCNLQSEISERPKIEVILREHVDHVGRRGDLVKVADGYARNYLLPRKLALLATEGNKKQVERERAKFEIKELEEQKSAQAVADRMANIEIEISRKVGETEALYGSVTSADVADALAAKGFELDRRKLHLPDPIKRLGEYEVPIRLHRDVTVKLKVRVVAEGSGEKK